MLILLGLLLESPYSHKCGAHDGERKNRGTIAPIVGLCDCNCFPDYHTLNTYINCLALYLFAFFAQLTCNNFFALLNEWLHIGCVFRAINIICESEGVVKSKLSSCFLPCICYRCACVVFNVYANHSLFIYPLPFYKTKMGTKHCVQLNVASSHTIVSYFNFMYNNYFTCLSITHICQNKRHVTLMKKYLNNSKFILISISFAIQFIKNKHITLGFLNPGSLGTRHDEFIVALEDRSVDILAINETWLRAGEELRAPAPPGYRLRHIPRPASVRSRGGGVGFYIRQGIYARQIKLSQTTDVEQMWLSVTLCGVKLAIGTAYRPPWLSLDTFIDALTETVSSLSAFDQILLMGDFNVNLLVTNDPSTKKLTTFFQYLNLVQYVTQPTHFTDHSETLLDLICSTTGVYNLSVDYIPDLSNHAFITCMLRVKRPKIPPRWICYRPIKDIDLADFNRLVNSIAWERMLNGDVNEAVLSFNAYILHIFNIHAPVIKSYLRHHSYPWITPTIREMMRLRDTAHNKSRSTGLKSDLQFYKDMKTVVKRALFFEKSAYFRQNINQNHNNPKALWKSIKRNVADFNSKQASLPPNINKPDLINKFFIDVPGSNSVSMSDLTYFEHNRFGSAVFRLNTVDEGCISNIILNISTNAEGVDGITRDMILLTLPRTLGVITSIVNKSIHSGIFPDIWKEGLVKPIPKNNSPSEFKDLRPISILPFLSKVLERVICQQLTKFLDCNNILPQKQSGFRAGHSTATALLDVVDDILAEEDVGKGSVLALLDFSRAFDCINHNLLLSKMSFYGFDNSALKWFHSYLDGRSQHVEVSQEDGTKLCSGTTPLKRGVPQGSILGPILFIMYTADLTECIDNSKFHIYADDLQIYLSFRPKDTINAVNLINQDLERINSWANRNCLVLNPNKSKFLVLGSDGQINKIRSLNPLVKIADSVIEQVTEARNLGVLMDNRLKFHDHVVETVKNCFFRLKILYKVRNFLDVNVRIQLCESLVLSKLNYADTVIGECLYGYTKKTLQRLQNSCVRFCYNVPRRAHITPFLKEGNLLNMEYRRALHLACLLFGIVNAKSPPYLYNKLTFSKRDRLATRLVCPRHSTAAFRGSFRYSATKCWNNIPPPLQSSQTLESFRRNYKKYIFNLHTGVAGVSGQRTGR